MFKKSNTLVSVLSSVLQILEQLGLKGNTNSFEDFTKLVNQEIKKEGLKHMYKLVYNFIILNIYI